jgi:dsDNA-specific endonuclease/ATPase MutS2
LEGSGIGVGTLTDDPPDDDGSDLADPDPERTIEVSIEKEIDLHAFQPRDILSVVEAYLDACVEKGFSEVRLIHGRGRGVQRAAVHRLLRERADVADFGDASPLSGGWGATIVRLVTPTRAGDREKK